MLLRVPAEISAQRSDRGVAVDQHMRGELEAILWCEDCGSRWHQIRIFEVSLSAKRVTSVLEVYLTGFTST